MKIHSNDTHYWLEYEVGLSIRVVATSLDCTITYHGFKEKTMTVWEEEFPLMTLAEATQFAISQEQ